MDTALLLFQRGLKGNDSSSSVNVKTVDIPLNLKYSLEMGSIFGVFLQQVLNLVLMGGVAVLL
jgi:hypothetical protein